MELQHINSQGYLTCTWVMADGMWMGSSGGLFSVGSYFDGGNY
jgi:hypothetical protein